VCCKAREGATHVQSSISIASLRASWRDLPQRAPATSEQATISAATFAHILATAALAKVLEPLLLIKAPVAQWFEMAAAYYAAAALYDQISRLSDAELDRRGLSRASLAQDIADARRRWRPSTE
jgi:hypothetical protein